tara:strand:+ start:2740 stop:3027 length:288 start_codon:yes stop_codon:yes gene_type:complete
MVCPSCGSSGIRVVDINKDYLNKSGAALLDWWAEDCFIVRKRGCKSCGETWRSVEIPIDDLKEVLDEKSKFLRSAVDSAAQKLTEALEELEEISR